MLPFDRYSLMNRYAAVICAYAEPAHQCRYKNISHNTIPVQEQRRQYADIHDTPGTSRVGRTAHMEAVVAGGKIGETDAVIGRKRLPVFGISLQTVLGIQIAVVRKIGYGVIDSEQIV